MRNPRMSRHLFTLMIPFVMLFALPAVLAQDIHVSADARSWIIESVGTATASPNVIHLMMKMEYQGAQAADATARGEKQLAEFLAAVEALTIPNLTYRACNTVFTSGQASQGAASGFVYTRN